MIEPNLYTLTDYGLHKFKDGTVMLIKRHKCGDWQIVRPPSTEEFEYFERFGQKVEKK